MSPLRKKNVVSRRETKVVSRRETKTNVWSRKGRQMTKVVSRRETNVVSRRETNGGRQMLSPLRKKNVV